MGKGLERVGKKKKRGGERDRTNEQEQREHLTFR